MWKAQRSLTKNRTASFWTIVCKKEFKINFFWGEISKHFYRFTYLLKSYKDFSSPEQNFANPKLATCKYAKIFSTFINACLFYHINLIASKWKIIAISMM